MAAGCRSMFYDKTAALCDSIMNLALTAPTVGSLISQIPLKLHENPRILDLGCGTGLAASTMRKTPQDAMLNTINSPTAS